MLPALLLIAVCGLSEAVLHTHPTYLIREHRTNLNSLSSLDDISSNANRYEIVAVDDNALPETSTQTSLMDYVLNPVNAVTAIGSTLIPWIQWFLVNGVQVLFGVAMTVGICMFTSACTITIDNPSSFSIPYLDNIQNYFNIAYNTYQSMQNDTPGDL